MMSRRYNFFVTSLFLHRRRATAGRGGYNSAGCGGLYESALLAGRLLPVLSEGPPSARGTGAKTTPNAPAVQKSGTTGAKTAQNVRIPAIRLGDEHKNRPKRAHPCHPPGGLAQKPPKTCASLPSAWGTGAKTAETALVPVIHSGDGRKSRQKCSRCPKNWDV